MAAYSNEMAKVIAAENNDKLVAFNTIPYSLINKALEGSAKEIIDELSKIAGYYKIYDEGSKFTTEGSNGDYVPANLRYRMVSSLINKEARFLFAEPPDVVIEYKGGIEKATEDVKDAVTVLDAMVADILDKNMFEDSLLKAAKDCFIGKRVIGVVNFNEEDGVTISFLPSTQFVYETKPGNQNVLTKLVCFDIIKKSKYPKEKRIFQKTYVIEKDGYMYIEEIMFDGSGTLVEVVTEYQQTLMKTIPAVLFINDGLTGDTLGESEVKTLCDHEEWYSKLSNSDKDAERKSMNPTRYTIDMDNRSTTGLSSAAGAYWDLLSDQNLEKPSPQIGLLESNLGYSEALKTTLERIKASAYELIDMPNITLESMQGSITSGKALKAIYWPLIVRCKEKMKMWGPKLRTLIGIIIDGAILYPNCVKMYTNEDIIPISYDVKILHNLPLPEDEEEEKQIDIAEVNANVRSRKSYMKKWFELTDSEAEEELEQMAIERQILEDSSFGTGGGTGMSEEDEFGEGATLEDEEEGEDEIENEFTALEAELEGM